MAVQGLVCLFILYVLESDILGRVVRPMTEGKQLDNVDHQPHQNASVREYLIAFLYGHDLKLTDSSLFE